MKAIHALQTALNPYIRFSYWRLECLSQFVFGLLMVNDVNLSKIARTFCSGAQIGSHYKRLQRFIRDISWDDLTLFGLAEGLFDLPDQMFFAIDRTNWKFGQFNINILTLAIVYEGIAIPILWSMLSKRGNSNYKERITLCERLLKVVGHGRIKGILADREFVGQDWFNWLTEQKIPFVIRCKDNTMAANAKGIPLPLKLMLRNIKPGKAVQFPKKRQIMGNCLYIIALRLEDGDLLTLLTDAKPEQALDHYKLRWEIEQLFSCLKSRGFNFENTHLNKEERISNLTFVLCITFMFAYRQGEITASERPVRIKKHGYAEKSLFRIGMEILASAIFNKSGAAKKLCKLIKELFNPPKPFLNQRLQGGVL